jgi:hypothetical protein
MYTPPVKFCYLYRILGWHLTEIVARQIAFLLSLLYAWHVIRTPFALKLSS